MKKINPRKNFDETCQKIGYINRKDAQQADYDRIGFKSGLEVHQQLLTAHKLFCRCPAGHFQKATQFDAEVIRHMRPTLSELGEYDGTALMEFKTRKEIVYHLANETACTYEVDDTPPFPIDREALDKAIKIALVSKMNIVGEVHITRKQYLDGSIPTGFQRTAIIGVEGELPLKNRKIGLIQLSIEEDACREVSDIKHRRVYRTDRLGMPLIETVTYPEMVNPDEVKEACDQIRFLNRSTGNVRTGIGAGREDVNVSCTGGTRIEIKGVAHTKWIPELSHVECFRQWALIAIKDELNRRIKKEDWKMQYAELNPQDYTFYFTPIQESIQRKEKLYAVNFPQFAGILSHFTQPGKPFYDEFVHRLKVIACLEKPNMATSEDLEDVVSDHVFENIQSLFNADENDAQIVFWAPESDVQTALEVLEERALMAFDGVPKETRKSMEDGTTIFERVLPGADRMYPDTDSVPIPLSENHIAVLRENLPSELADIQKQYSDWHIPTDCLPYLLTQNFYPIIKKITEELHICPKYLGCFIGHRIKHWHGQYRALPFEKERIYSLFAFLQKENIHISIASSLAEQLFKHPRMEFENILNLLKFKRISDDEIKSTVPDLQNKFTAIRKNSDANDKKNSIMGNLRKKGEGNISLTELAEYVSR